MYFGCLLDESFFPFADVSHPHKNPFPPPRSVTISYIIKICKIQTNKKGRRLWQDVSGYSSLLLWLPGSVASSWTEVWPVSRRDAARKTQTRGISERRAFKGLLSSRIHVSTEARQEWLCILTADLFLVFLLMATRTERSQAGWDHIALPNGVSPGISHFCFWKRWVLKLHLQWAKQRSKQEIIRER